MNEQLKDMLVGASKFEVALNNFSAKSVGEMAERRAALRQWIASSLLVVGVEGGEREN